MPTNSENGPAEMMTGTRGSATVWRMALNVADGRERSQPGQNEERRSGPEKEAEQSGRIATKPSR